MTAPERKDRMKDPLTRLTERTATLGNYNRKYLHVISNNIEKLTSCLEQRGKLDRVHLWGYSLEIPGEMDTILEIVSGTREKLDFLGCYFGLQFLHMNLRLVDIIKLELATSPDRARAGKRLMLESGRMFRYLTKCYMERLLDIFLEGKSVPDFVMLGVGTRADQDDIDLGLVHQQPGDIEGLNMAIGQLASEMFKKANRLHFHLSEHVGENSFTATIEQYEEILDKGAYDFVIVTEMLGGALILGSYPIYEQFLSRVTNRFYYDPGNKQNRFHESYLRGILGEINSLLTRLRLTEAISPKDDALRPMKSLLSALKLVYGVHKVNAWNIIDELKEKNPERRSQYEDLERTLSFFEIFRHLYQIMVAQDEEILLREPGVKEMVAKIANMLGFERKGVVSAEDFMLVIYYEFLGKSTQAIEVLTEDLKKHLREVSIFKPIFSGDIHRKPGFEGNLAVDFIRASTFVKGITYWDDFQEQLREKDNRFYDEFIESLDQLPERVRKKVAQGYVAGTAYSPASVLRFLVIVGEKARSEQAKKVFETLSSLFVDELRALPNTTALLTQLLHSYPEMLNRFLALIKWETLAEFVKLVHRKPSIPELLPGYEQLHSLAEIHYQSSHFFKQHFHKVLNKFPVFIKNLHNNDRLMEFTNGVYSDLTSFPSIKERLEHLGDYYDLEFVRVSLLAMAGVGCERTDAEFVEFCDNYTHSLYEFCQHDVHLSVGYSMHTQDLFAIYATGGHAREQGFDDDYDMIVILDSSDGEQIDYCNKIVARMNSHITRRGILPHHRFTDYFGSYTISFEQLADHLGKDHQDLFVDQSQILSSRMLVGSNKLERKLQEKIIGPLIFARAGEYIDYMRGEMQSRHTSIEADQLDDMKECPGGLRDIEMLLLMYKAKHRTRDPLSRKFLHLLVELEPDYAEQFGFLEDHLNFVKNLRDLYRLKVAAHNVLSEETLLPVAESMGYGEDEKAAGKLYDDFLERTKLASTVINKLVDSVKT
jgi:hypothetical protein